MEVEFRGIQLDSYLRFSGDDQSFHYVPSDALRLRMSKAGLESDYGKVEAICNKLLGSSDAQHEIIVPGAVIAAGFERFGSPVTFDYSFHEFILMDRDGSASVEVLPGNNNSGFSLMQEGHVCAQVSLDKRVRLQRDNAAVIVGFDADMVITRQNLDDYEVISGVREITPWTINTVLSRGVKSFMRIVRQHPDIDSEGKILLYSRQSAKADASQLPEVDQPFRIHFELNKYRAKYNLLDISAYVQAQGRERCLVARPVLCLYPMISENLQKFLEKRNLSYDSLSTEAAD